MTWFNLHAIILLALPLITGVLLLVIPRRHPAIRNVVTATLIAGGAASVGFTLGSHMCGAGQGGSACVSIGPCIWIVRAYLKCNSANSCIAAVMVGIMFVVSLAVTQ